MLFPWKGKEAVTGIGSQTWSTELNNAKKVCVEGGRQNSLRVSLVFCIYCKPASMPVDAQWLLASEQATCLPYGMAGDVSCSFKLKVTPSFLLEAMDAVQKETIYSWMTATINIPKQALGEVIGPSRNENQCFHELCCVSDWILSDPPKARVLKSWIQCGSVERMWKLRNRTDWEVISHWILSSVENGGTLRPSLSFASCQVSTCVPLCTATINPSMLTLHSQNSGTISHRQHSPKPWVVWYCSNRKLSNTSWPH